MLRTEASATEFAEWIVRNAPQLQADLSFKKPRVVARRVQGFEAILGEYRWPAKIEIEAGEQLFGDDWPSSKCLLERISRELRGALDAEDDDKVWRLCRQIIRWGGGIRLGEKGAYGFLEAKYKNGCLGAYLRCSAKLLDLSVSGEEEWRQIEGMNSMLTKIHALASADGLPIYDSRVAGAVGALAELFRRDVKRPLAADIRFPALQNRRTAVAVGGDKPDMLRYSSAVVAFRWTSAKVRLGRLMRQVVGNPMVFPAEDDPRARMHALEATLFVIGYDPACLTPNMA